jgi:hypothetical protein
VSDTVAAILDTSALLAYADPAAATAVGELLGEIHAEDRLIAVPAACLAAAYAAVGDDEFATEQLMLLRTASRIAFLPLAEDDAQQVGGYAHDAGGDVAVGHAAHLAIQHEAYYATAQPKRAAAVLPPGWVILDLST